MEVKPWRAPDDVMLVAKQQSPTMRLLGVFLGARFMTHFWTTYRLPFQRRVRISYPMNARGMGTVIDGAGPVIEHEMHHVEQFRPWWGPWVFIALAVLLPLPVLFSGRWFIERRAYLNDIRKGRCTVEQAADMLWRSYGWCWPRPLMRRWLRKELGQ